MIVLEHTIPFFLPLSDLENDLLFSNAKVPDLQFILLLPCLLYVFGFNIFRCQKFIDNVGDLLQAYVDRKEQVRLIKELFGHQISEIYHSLPYHMIEFSMDDCDWLAIS